jgi:hypothetical protein
MDPGPPRGLEPLAPATTRSRRARACREVAVKAASLARAATRRPLPVRATTPLLPARECLVLRVAVRLLRAPAVPAPERRARTLA